MTEQTAANRPRGGGGGGGGVVGGGGRRRRWWAVGDKRWAVAVAVAIAADDGRWAVGGGWGRC